MPDLIQTVVAARIEIKIMIVKGKANAVKSDKLRSLFEMNRLITQGENATTDAVTTGVFHWVDILTLQNSINM